MAIDLLKRPLFLVEQTNQELVAENLNLKNSIKIFNTLIVTLGLALTTIYVLAIVYENKSNESEL